MKTALTIAASALAILLGGPPAAWGEVVLGEDFESGPAGWTMDGLWHVQEQPEVYEVVSEIHPELVSLPDAGGLPSAAGGTHALWYGDEGSGTFCTDYASVTQAPKNGCRSPAPNSGRVVSPSFSLVGAASAQLVFSAWWEIEAVNADAFDLMKVQYSIDGAPWIDVGALNPVNNPAGAHHESYSNNGLKASPSWRGYVASLGDAVGESDVRISFSFDTVDAQYQGFRGLLIDNVSVSTPFTADAPEIAGVAPGCVSSTAESQVVVVEGENFIIDSTLRLDGAPVAGAATLSSTRMEFTVSDLPAGEHTVQVANPLGAVSNAATLRSAPDCAAQPTPPPPPPGPGTTTRPQRTTATQVICNRGPNPNDTSECIATVGDSDAPPRITPTGTVTFTTTTGAFLNASTCQLVPTPMSPGVASCSAIYTPPAEGGFPAVTATYGGDDDHLGSAGATSFIIAGPPSTDPSDPARQLGPEDCPAILAAAGRGAPRIDRDENRVPEHEYGVGDCLWYNSRRLGRHTIHAIAQTGTVVVGTVVGVGAPVVGAIGGAEVGAVPGAVIGGVTGIGITKEYVIPATTDTMSALYKANQRMLADPPDPEYKVVVRPAPVRVDALVASKGLSRRAAGAVTALVREQVRARNIADAISLAIDKAGGAKLAGDDKWVGVQMRATIGYCKRLAASARRLVKLQRTAARAAAKSRLLSEPLATRKQLAKRLHRRVTHGFTKRERRVLRARFGMSKKQIEALPASLRALKARRVPRSAADFLGDRRLIDTYRSVAETLDAFVIVPSVLEDAALPGSGASTSGPSVASTRLRHRKGRIAVELSCGATPDGPCTGTLLIRRGKAVIGRAGFEVAEGSGAVVSVQPTRRGRRIIAAARRQKIAVVLDPARGERVSRRLTLVR